MFEPRHPLYAPTDTHLTDYHVPYFCDIGAFKGIQVDLIFGGMLFGSYEADSQFNISGITAYLTVPQYLINAAQSLYDAQTFVTTVSSVTIGLTNASPSTSNALSSPIVLTAAYEPTGGLQLTVPQTGNLTVGPFTAGSTAGDYMYLSLGNATGVLDIKAANGTTTQTDDVSCHPDGQLDLYGCVPRSRIMERVDFC